jgi:cyclase
MGDIITLVKRYRDEGADELVFYDITASSDQRSLDYTWVTKISKVLDIPFCVAGGIRNIQMAKQILNEGADKISINSPALEDPQLISALAYEFGSQCLVVGIDSYEENNDYYVYQYTGDPKKTLATQRRTMDWVDEVQKLGAGEIVLNCMNQDGVRKGYDIVQLAKVKQKLSIPLVASGGAGAEEHFLEVFQKANVDGALAASVFHTGQIHINHLKQFLKQHQIAIRV